MIALGTLHNKSATEDLHLAKELLITCRELYKRTKTGILLNLEIDNNRNWSRNCLFR